jgi:uncharacterized membrane protein
MARRRYWNGFATGAAIGIGASLTTLVLTRLIGRTRGSRIIRLQKSVQIGRPVEEVFNAWSDLDQLARSSPLFRSITSSGEHSHWVMDLDRRQIEWDSEIEQLIPNQAIGWKSLNGPKHTGRVSFSPIGNDTLVNVTMNYAPPLRFLRLSPIKEHIQNLFEQVLRDFKATLEGKGQEGAIRTGTTGTHFHTAAEEPRRATGTFGATGQQNTTTQHTRFGGPTNPAEYTRPPEAKS